MNLFNLMDQAAARFPDRGAVHLGEQRFATYRELRSRALASAGAMARDARPGDRVAIVAKNCREYVEMPFAAWAAGLVVVPVNAKLHPREMAEIIEDSGAALLFASNQILTEIQARQGATFPNVVAIGGHEYTEMLAASPIIVAADVSPETLAWLFYNSL